MRRIRNIAAAVMLASLVLMLTACGKSEFGVTENTGKRMTITAQNALKDASFMVGSLEVEAGEEITITSNLTKGSIRVEIVGTPEEQSIDALPSMDGEAVITADLSGGEGAAGTVPTGSYLLKAVCLEKANGDIQIEVKPAAESAEAGPEADYGFIQSDFSGMTPEIAGAYLAVMDEIAAHLGYHEAEAAAGEYLHGGFVRDWNGDGTPELCLLLKTSPRDTGSWDGTPIYGWYPPTLYLYTLQDGQTVQAGEVDLYFGTAGREAAVAARMTEDGVQCVCWDRNDFAGETYADRYELVNGKLQKNELSDEETTGWKSAETVQAFLDTLGDGNAQLLLYNSSGDAKIEGAENAQKLREALVSTAA